MSYVMYSNPRPLLQGLKVVSFESRRSREIAELIRRYGGEPILAPSMREVPLNENRSALELLPQLEAGRFDVLILMTGVGTRTLNEALLTRYSQEQIKGALQRVKLVARGPKPVGVLKELGLRPDLGIPEPNTWREVFAALDADMELRNKKIAIQEYGIPDRELVAKLEARGATVATVPVYRWELPEDLTPLRMAMQTILAGHADIALFTNATQVDHLFKVAGYDRIEKSLPPSLARIVIGSVGPICTQVLERFGLKPDIEPTHPKMGSLIAEVAASAGRILQAKRRL
jgi:uroporphyrinogen-III synthase